MTNFEYTRFYYLAFKLIFTRVSLLTTDDGATKTKNKQKRKRTYLKCRNMLSFY